MKRQSARPARGGGQHRLRLGRRSIEGQVYLLTMVTRDREPVFAAWPAARAASAAIHGAVHPSHSLCWVLMPDHLHLLVQLGPEMLATLVHRVKGHSVRAVNRTISRRGSLWQPGFHDHGVRIEASLRATARYVIANPLRAGLVERVGDYPYWDAVWLNGHHPD